MVFDVRIAVSAWPVARSHRRRARGFCPTPIRPLLRQQLLGQIPDQRLVAATQTSPKIL